MWEQPFYNFLSDRGLVRSTILHHIHVLNTEFICKTIQKRYPGDMLADLDPNTSLYILQADICMSGQENWRDAWTSISYFRLWKQSLSSSEATVNESELEKTFRVIANGQITISQQLQTVLQEFSNRLTIGNQRDTLQNDREAELNSRERQLRLWEEDLRQREKELTEKYKGMCELRVEVAKGKAGRKRREGHEYIRHTQDEDDRKRVRNRIRQIHAHLNIGTSNKLFFLMIAMRDCGFLYENVDVTGFLRLMTEWKILELDDKATKSVANAMDYVKDRLPDRGKHDFRGWTENYAVDDRRYVQDIIDLIAMSEQEFEKRLRAVEQES